LGETIKLFSNEKNSALIFARPPSFPTSASGKIWELKMSSKIGLMVATVAAVKDEKIVFSKIVKKNKPTNGFAKEKLFKK
jgi:hypothetical protein